VCPDVVRVLRSLPDGLTVRREQRVILLKVLPHSLRLLPSWVDFDKTHSSPAPAVVHIVWAWGPGTGVRAVLRVDRDQHPVPECDHRDPVHQHEVETLYPIVSDGVADYECALHADPVRLDGH